ncbi:MAG: Concanavalin A-like lectin/glucanase superfamily [Frankiales bacterium]|nr:Concanavalin A-like lectin/glucanase superfamily [Frankiales bacterium]
MRSAHRRRPGSRSAVTVGLATVLVLAGCSHSKPTPSPGLQGLSAYERAARTDGAAALWPLRDAQNLSARDEVGDLISSKAAATVVGGTIAGTTGPDGAGAARFFRSGRLVTPVTSGLSSASAFSLEFDLRADECVNAWGRVLGTTSLQQTGREGFEVLHFPKQFAINPCRFGVEFWHLGKYEGGCHPKPVPVNGVWTRWAVVYAKGRVTCYENGTLVQSTLLAAPRVFQQLGPLGIGGSGSGFQGPLDGASLSEVALYRRALTSAEVGQHASLSTSVRPTPTASSS